MASTTQVPLELYLHTTYEPDAEYVDGEIEERPVGENSHSAWQAAIQRWFFRNEEQWNVLVRPELRVQTGPTRFRVPDVAILDAAQPQLPITTYPPLTVFEVLSPEDAYKRLIRKLADYEQMGIPAIWVVDPDTGIFERFQNSQLTRKSEFSLPEQGIVFPVTEIAQLVR